MKKFGKTIIHICPNLFVLLCLGIAYLILFADIEKIETFLILNGLGFALSIFELILGDQDKQNEISKKVENLLRKVECYKYHAISVPTIPYKRRKNAVRKYLLSKRSKGKTSTVCYK